MSGKLTRPIEEILAWNLRAGDDLFGAGIIESVIRFTYPESMVVVGIGHGNSGITLAGDDVVTVRRGE